MGAAYERRRAWYDTGALDEGLSDHAPMVVEIERGTGGVDHQPRTE